MIAFSFLGTVRVDDEESDVLTARWPDGYLLVFHGSREMLDDPSVRSDLDALAEDSRRMASVPS